MAAKEKTAHALLSASGAKQWLACTPSARLSAQFADNSGTAAAEGTLAHTLAEVMLKFKLGIYTEKMYKSNLKVIQSYELYTPAMLDYIEAYVARVLESYAEAKTEASDAIILLEERLDFSQWVSEGFGTGDVLINSFTKLRIRDLKFGKGVPVSAVENPQMMLYALGSYAEYGYLSDLKEIEMIIDQPRLDSVSKWTISTEDLLAWANDVLKPAAVLAFAGEGKFNPSEETCRFCRARGVCRANAEFNLALAEYDFKPAPTLTLEEISDILSRASQFTNWLKGVTDHAFDQALNHNVKYPGYKIVEGRSNRKYTDEAAILEVLENETVFSESDLTTPRKLLGITALEKVVGKSNMEAFVNAYLVKAPGAPTLVPETDKRPEYNSAEKDFSIMESED